MLFFNMLSIQLVQDHLRQHLSFVEGNLAGFALPSSIYLGYPKWFGLLHWGGIGFAELLSTAL